MQKKHNEIQQRSLLDQLYPNITCTELAILCDGCQHHDGVGDMSAQQNIVNLDRSIVWETTGATGQWRHTKFSYHNDAVSIA